MRALLGRNNRIANCAVIHNNVRIGDNNFIGKGVVVYPNTTIGSNNHIFNGNVIGECPVSSSDMYRDYNVDSHKGVVIGNNNLFHVKNIIFQGIDNPTRIGDNNKFLAEGHIGHDACIDNNVTLYPRVICGGHSVLLDSCSVGMYASIHQRCVVGQYSMVGGAGMTKRPVFPFYVSIGNKIHRLNDSKIPPEVARYDSVLRGLNNQFASGNLEFTGTGNAFIDGVIRTYARALR